jgi:hypothetical protein
MMGRHVAPADAKGGATMTTPSRAGNLTIVHGERSGPVAKPAEILDYLAAMSGEMASLADRYGVEMLAGLLELAQREAELELARHHVAKSQAPLAPSQTPPATT